jgi:hypothetical protein
MRHRVAAGLCQPTWGRLDVFENLHEGRASSGGATYKESESRPDEARPLLNSVLKHVFRDQRMLAVARRKPWRR